MKKPVEVKEILEAYDLTGSLRGTAILLQRDSFVQHRERRRHSELDGQLGSVNGHGAGAAEALS